MAYLLIFFSAIFVNNIVFSQFLGICPFLGVSKKVDTALGMSAAVAFVLTIATIVTYLIQGLLVSYHLEYLQTIAFIVPGARRLPAAHHHELRHPRRRHPRGTEHLQRPGP